MRQEPKDQKQKLGKTTSNVLTSTKKQGLLQTLSATGLVLYKLVFETIYWHLSKSQMSPKKNYWLSFQNQLIALKKDFFTPYGSIY